VTAASPALEAFVRGTLGCGCPAEVFDSVEVSATPPPGCPEVQRRISVGGRLLIYVIDATNADQVPVRLEAWVSAGVAERERRGMNRLRLAVVLDDSGVDQSAKIDQAFVALPLVRAARARGEDPRIHLHCLSRADTEALWPSPELD
jgi:hypothetical protein